MNTPTAPKDERTRPEEVAGRALNASSAYEDPTAPDSKRSADIPDRIRAGILRGNQIGKIRRPPALVSGLIARSSVFSIIGPPKSMKTFAALDLGLSVATGTPWAGRSTEQGTVLYVLLEGAGDLGTRYNAWRDHHGHADIEAFETLTGFDLDLTDRRTAEHLGTHAKGHALVIIDTLSRAIAGADENSSGPMSLAMANLTRIASLSDAAVGIVAHTGKTGSTARGHSAFAGAVDTELSVSRTKQTVTIRQTLSRSFREGQAFTVHTLEHSDSVVLVHRDIADELTALTHRAVDILADGVARSKNELVAELGVNKTRALAAIDRGIEEGQVAWQQGPRGAHLLTIASSGSEFQVVPEPGTSSRNQFPAPLFKGAGRKPLEDTHDGAHHETQTLSPEEGAKRLRQPTERSEGGRERSDNLPHHELTPADNEMGSLPLTPASQEEQEPEPAGGRVPEAPVTQTTDISLFPEDEPQDERDIGRSSLRRPAASDQTSCGTKAGYTRHHEANEPPCDRCETDHSKRKAANAERMRKSRAQKQAAKTGQAPKAEPTNVVALHAALTRQDLAG